MAKRRLIGSPKRAAPALDEFGGTADGGLAILDTEERRIHMTTPRVAAALRYFVARVQLHDTNGMPARLAITSALLGEGVTYVARSIAAVIAYDTEASVVVVDLNWRRPSTDPDAPRLLGVADVVEGNASVNDVVQRTTNPRLSLVPAGEVRLARRPSLVRSSLLASVLDELDDQFDHVLFDLPPVLASSEAMNLTQTADSFVLVVRQGVTTEGQVEAALEELKGAEALGVILNRYHTSIPRRIRRLVGV